MSPPIGAARAALQTQTDAIPDSAIDHRWPIDEGSGGTVFDDQGSLDGTKDGASWSSVADAQGGYELDFDGSNDSVNFSSETSTLDTSTNFTVAFTIRIDDLGAGDQLIIYHTISDDNRVQCGIDASSNFIFQVDNPDQFAVSWSGASSGTRVRLAITVDNTNNNIKIYENTSDSTGSGSFVGNFVGSGAGHRWGERADDIRQFGGELDDVVYYNTILDSTQIQEDYDRQPWS
jgi:hypothetical protein